LNRRSLKAVIGVADHCGWAVLVTVTAGGRLVDRRRVELVDAGLPKLPHHHECQSLPLREAIALVEQVRESALTCATAALESLATSVSATITGIALRRYPPLPPTIAERITSYQAQCAADGVMYRDVLAQAARDRGWRVAWYDPKQVNADASQVLGIPSIDALLDDTGATLGPPWQKDHRLAMSAAIAAHMSTAE
jgi:hypothetical protein